MMHIVSYVRPELNLSQDFNQAAHLLEHLILTNARRAQLAKKAVLVNGYTSELYMAIYTVTDYPEKLGSYGPDFSTLKEAKSTLEQELSQKNPEYVKKLLAALYKPSSPALRQKLFTLDHFTQKQLQEIFASHQNGYDLDLSYDRYGVPDFSTEKNTLKRGDAALDSGVQIKIPVDINNDNYTALQAWCFAAGDSAHGKLYALLRSLGLIYHMEVYVDFYSNAISIEFDSTAGKKAINEVISWLKSYTFDTEEELFGYYQRDLKTLWQDPRQYSLGILEEVAIGGITIPPKDRVYADGCINKIHRQLVEGLPDTLVLS